MEAGAYPAGGAGEPPDAATAEMPRLDEAPGAGGESPASAHAAAQHDPFAEKPELYVGAAFAGGLIVAQLLKRLGR